jgi:hypothetical protein
MDDGKPKNKKKKANSSPNLNSSDAIQSQSKSFVPLQLIDRSIANEAGFSYAVESQSKSFVSTTDRSIANEARLLHTRKDRPEEERRRDDEDTHRLAHAQVFAFAARPCRRVGNATRSSEHVYCTNTCRKKSVYPLPGVVVRVDVKTGFTPVDGGAIWLLGIG